MGPVSIWGYSSGMGRVAEHGRLGLYICVCKYLVGEEVWRMVCGYLEDMTAYRRVQCNPIEEYTFRYTYLGTYGC